MSESTIATSDNEIKRKGSFRRSFRGRSRSPSPFRRTKTSDKDEERDDAASGIARSSSLRSNRSSSPLISLVRSVHSSFSGKRKSKRPMADGEHRTQSQTHVPPIPSRIRNRIPPEHDKQPEADAQTMHLHKNSDTAQSSSDPPEETQQSIPATTSSVGTNTAKDAKSEQINKSFDEEKRKVLDQNHGENSSSLQQESIETGGVVSSTDVNTSGDVDTSFSTTFERSEPIITPDTEDNIEVKVSTTSESEKYDNIESPSNKDSSKNIIKVNTINDQDTPIGATTDSNGGDYSPLREASSKLQESTTGSDNGNNQLKIKEKGTNFMKEHVKEDAYSTFDVLLQDISSGEISGNTADLLNEYARNVVVVASSSSSVLPPEPAVPSSSSSSEEEEEEEKISSSSSEEETSTDGSSINSDNDDVGFVSGCENPFQQVGDLAQWFWDEPESVPKNYTAENRHQRSNDTRRNRQSQSQKGRRSSSRRPAGVNNFKKRSDHTLQKKSMTKREKEIDIAKRLRASKERSEAKQKPYENELLKLRRKSNPTGAASSLRSERKGDRYASRKKSEKVSRNKSTGRSAKRPPISSKETSRNKSRTKSRPRPRESNQSTSHARKGSRQKPRTLHRRKKSDSPTRGSFPIL